MNQEERRKFLIEYLAAERGEAAKMPEDGDRQKRLLRAYLNVRPPKKASEEFLRIQDEYFKEELRLKGVVDFKNLIPVIPDIYLWKGDITTLKCDVIVNAANSQMLGCFLPNHGCIDNVIHTYSGVQLRLECAKIMEKQGKVEPVGSAKITKAYNLPCKYILHTVGPRVFGSLTSQNESQLANCYKSCLALAEEKGLKSIAFCCISTGEFCFPNERAAEIALASVIGYKKERGSGIKVIFNVFKEIDYAIYKTLFGVYR